MGQRLTARSISGNKLRPQIDNTSYINGKGKRGIKILPAICDIGDLRSGFCMGTVRHTVSGLSSRFEYEFPRPTLNGGQGQPWSTSDNKTGCIAFRQPSAEILSFVASLKRPDLNPIKDPIRCLGPVEIGLHAREYRSETHLNAFPCVVGVNFIAQRC
jgi:hypothetical protein